MCRDDLRDTILRERTGNSQFLHFPLEYSMFLLSYFESSNFALSHLNNWGIHIWNSIFFNCPEFILFQASREYFDEVVCVHTILNCQMIETILSPHIPEYVLLSDISSIKGLFLFNSLDDAIPLTLSFSMCALICLFTVHRNKSCRFCSPIQNNTDHMMSCIVIYLLHGCPPSSTRLGR